MAIQQNDIYQVRIQGEVFDQQCENVFWYAANIIGVEDQLAQGLGLSVQTNIIGNVIGIQSNVFEWTHIQVVNWRVPLEDQYEADLATVGLVNAEAYPSYVSASFTSPDPGIGLRPASKRFAGISANHINRNNPDFLLDWVAVAIALGTSIGVGTAVLNPVLVRRQINKVNVFPPMGTGNPIAPRTVLGQWTFDIGTQNSRKKGVGA